jgi:hypothetical protein
METILLGEVTQSYLSTLRLEQLRQILSCELIPQGRREERHAAEHCEGGTWPKGETTQKGERKESVWGHSGRHFPSPPGSILSGNSRVALCQVPIGVISFKSHHIHKKNAYYYYCPHFIDEETKAHLPKVILLLSCRQNLVFNLDVLIFRRWCPAVTVHRSSLAC